MSQHSKDSSLRTVTKMINSLLVPQFRRDQYQDRLLNKMMRNLSSHIQICSDRSWWKSDFWISALSSRVHLLNVSLINILLLTHEVFLLRRIAAILIDSRRKVVESEWKVLMIASINEECFERLDEICWIDFLIDDYWRSQIIDQID
jgi:hypothetical protein